MARLRTRSAALSAHFADRSRPRALVLEWTDPPMSGGHWTPSLVQLAGGVPVLGNHGENSVVLSWPAIAAADPDVIIVAPCGFDLDATLRPGPRLVDTAELFATALHGEPYGAALTDFSAIRRIPGLLP